MKHSTIVFVVALSSMVALPISASAQSMTMTFTTTEAGGNYAPRNVAAAWVETTDGTFVKTLGRWAATRTEHLVAWNLASGYDIDGVSGATRNNNNDPLVVTWDFTDVANIDVAEGIYVIRLELADRNSTTADQNNQGSFMVDHNGVSATQTDVSDGGFTATEIEYRAAVIREPDAGGGVDECVDGDGSCPSSCTTANDNDCQSSGGGDNLKGGCRVATGQGGWLAVLGLAGLVAVRRRRNDPRRD